MAKVIDITEKLDFDSNPKLVIKGKEVEVNADAETVLKIMGEFGDKGDASPKSILSMYELIFSDRSRKELEKMKLSFKDLTTVVHAAMELIIGEDEAEGEQ